MTQSPWQAEAAPLAPSPLPDEADVVVVGAGVAGAGVAWALAEEAPGLRVHVVDAHPPATGASGRNAGFLLLGTHIDYATAIDAVGREAARAWWRLTEANLARVERLAETADLRLQRTGTLLAAGAAGEADRLRRSFDALRADGADVAWLDASDVAEQVGIRGLDGGIWTSAGGGVDPVRVVHAALRASGAGVTWGAAVAGVGTDRDAVCVTLADGRSVRAPRVVLALNAYLPRLVPSLAGAVRPVRAQMLATEPLPPVLAMPVYSHEGYYYLRQRLDGRVLMGGARHLHADAEVGYADETTDALQRDLARYLAEHLPAAAGAAVARRWSGVMGFSPDALPAVGPVAGVPGATYVAGFTGHGMALALRVGQIAARGALGTPDAAAALVAHTRPTLHESGRHTAS